MLGATCPLGRRPGPEGAGHARIRKASDRIGRRRDDRVVRGGGAVNAQCSYEIDVEGASSVRTNCGAVVSVPSAPVSDTSLEFGFGVNLLLGNQLLLRTEATFFDFDVYSGARFGLGAGMRF